MAEQISAALSSSSRVTFSPFLKSTIEPMDTAAALPFTVTTSPGLPFSRATTAVMILVRLAGAALRICFLA